MKRIHSWLAVAMVVVAAGACGSKSSDTPTGPTTTTGGSEINAGANAQFSPTLLTVAVGATVTWVFGPLTHNVTFAGATGVPNNIGDSADASISRTFSVAGTFTYQCTIHPGMTGTVKVQ